MDHSIPSNGNNGAWNLPQQPQQHQGVAGMGFSHTNPYDQHQYLNQPMYNHGHMHQPQSNAEHLQGHAYQTYQHPLPPAQPWMQHGAPLYPDQQYWPQQSTYQQQCLPTALPHQMLEQAPLGQQQQQHLYPPTHMAPAPAHFLGYMQPTPALPAQPQWTMSQPIPPPMAVPGGYAPHAPPTATWQQPSGRVEAAELSWNSIWPSPVQPAGNKGGEGSQLPRAPASGSDAFAGAFSPARAPARPAPSPQHPPSASGVDVLIWDLDETLICFQSFLDGRFAATNGGRVRCAAPGVGEHMCLSPAQAKPVAEELGSCWENLILQVSDEHFFFEEMEECDEMNMIALDASDDHQDLSRYAFTEDALHKGTPLQQDQRLRLNAYRMRVRFMLSPDNLSHIRDLYRRQATSLLSIGNRLVHERLYDRTDVFTTGWLTKARRLVEACQLAQHSSRTVVNVIVSAGQIIPTLAKLMLFHLHGMFPVENVYSSRRDGKLHCFKVIKERFGEQSRFVAIGDSREEKQAAEFLQWPFVQIALNISFPEALHNTSPQRVLGAVA